jgi:hypothetical protein
MKLRNAAVALVGRTVDIEDSFEFGTEKKDGVKVLLATGEGYASVKLNHVQFAELKPQPGQSVAWLVRYGATSSGNDYSTYVRPLDSDFLDKLVSAFKAVQGAAAAPKQPSPAAA